jgi:hypothetical protein
MKKKSLIKNKTNRPIIVTQKGEPIVQVVSLPAPHKKPSWLGSFKSKGKITGDIIFPALEGKKI